ncbi:nucleoside diphosphate kinase regulator [Ancylobacter sp. 6x-1]|uniref:Nucleoside diphosphate kinase regulator n=1 Tax=Ancylobacter crimeensis TaxID=2579147 RepID=A0ABT0D647_9HYPH|nr:nucleoside diphosphate kinase regulator [Ancylobacter crimeensis]MCK0195302.1 nucleoside diphosphate kinase regulator [Ancylobacter crimeensis]
MALARRKPAIAITRHDHEMLSRLADSYAARDAELADELYTELDRARIVGDGSARNVVRIGSALRFTSDAGEDRVVKLVLPGEADISAGKVSVMTPIGIALIGLSAGQSMDWTARDGRRHKLTVVSVEAPDVVVEPAARPMAVTGEQQASQS